MIAREVMPSRRTRAHLALIGFVAFVVSFAFMVVGRQWAISVAELRSSAVHREIQTPCEVPTLCENGSGIWRRCPWVRR